MSKIVAVVGMPGSGKSEIVRNFLEAGFQRVYFGDITFNRMKKEGLEISEKNERETREKLREEGGMGVFAKLSIPEIDSLLKKGKVVVESMYSWEEFLILKERYGDSFRVVAACASPKTRYARLAGRKIRPLNAEDAKSRDYTQLENLHTGGPIAIADFTVVNEGSMEELDRKVKAFIETLTTE